jgi:hypothetical protein
VELNSSVRFSWLKRMGEFVRGFRETSSDVLCLRAVFFQERGPIRRLWNPFTGSLLGEKTCFVVKDLEYLVQ